MTSGSLPSETIRLWRDGPPTKLEGVGPETEFRGPVGTAGDARMLRNVSEPALTVFRPTNANPNGVGVIERWWVRWNVRNSRGWCISRCVQ